MIYTMAIKVEKEKKGIPAFEFGFLIIAIGTILLKRRK